MGAVCLGLYLVGVCNCQKQLQEKLTAVLYLP